MIDLSTLDGRNFVILAAVLVAGFVVFTVLRLLQQGGRRRQAGGSVGPEGSSDGDDRAFVAGAEINRDAQQNGAQLAQPVRPARALADADDSESAPDFSRELARSSLELEVQQLRREAVQLRAEMTHLAEEMRNLKAVRNVSPLYGEAMTLAQQGEPPAGIAAQCGISVSEAELVAALARSESGFELHEKENDRDDRYTEPGN